MADDSAQIEYNQEFQALEELLESVERPGDFFAHGSVEIPMPKIEVEGVGILSFPISEQQVQQLVRQATRAPYGRGEETILDESVRKVWQLSPAKVRISGKSWPATFERILTQVISSLGCEGMAVSSELYKVLVYDTGGFFLAHRDTEKTRGMFGTLVVVLPSAHRGGDLVIRHGAREVKLDMSTAEISEVTFAAFYADCEHEVKPVIGGNRVCLVYNLIQQRGAANQDQSLLAPEYEEEIATASRIIQENLGREGAPTKIAWLLEHQYSPDGLSFAALKSADAARVRVLAQAALRAECVAHLGIVHISESGSAEGIYHGYASRGWRKYRDEDEEEDDETDEDFEVIEVCDSSQYIAEWRDLNDQAVDLGQIPLEPGELLPADALDGEKPDEQRFMEASGNEGASFERSYHRAALVLWRREREADVRLQAGVAAAVPYLRERIQSATAQNAEPDARQEVAALARKIVAAWKEAPDYSSYSRPQRLNSREEMLLVLAQLNDTALLAKFIAEVVVRDYDGSENSALVTSAPLLGRRIEKLYADLVRQHLAALPAECVDLLCALTKPGQPRLDRSALGDIAKAIVTKLDEIGAPRLQQVWTDWRAHREGRPLDAAFVSNLLNALDELTAPALRAAASQAFAARPHVFDPVAILVPGLASLRVWDEAALTLWEHCATFLLQRSGSQPEAPKDWRQEVKLSCPCVDCRELQAFAVDPVAQVGRFRVRKERRQHLHRIIEGHSLDMTHVTERTGSPQTLVCTKDRRSFKRRCEEYRSDIAALWELAKMAARRAAPASMLPRIQAALDQSESWVPG